MNEAAMPNVELSVGEIISNGISIGLKNFVSILLTYILFYLTIWIPYLNVGTIIAMQHLVPKLSRGESLSPTYIFDARYRKNFGEFFLLQGLFVAGLLGALLFFVVPAYVLIFAWMFALNLFVDRGTGPLESLRLSNTITYGNKLPIFLSFLVIWVILFIVQTIIGFTKSPGLVVVVSIIIALGVLPTAIGMLSYVYHRLTSALDSASPFGAEMVEPAPTM